MIGLVYIPFKDVFYSRRNTIIFLLVFNVLGILWGASGYGEPILTYISLLSFVPVVLLFLQIENLSLMKKKGVFPAENEFLSYAKGLSTAHTILGALASLPWTVFWAWYVKTYSDTYPIPHVPLISQIFLVVVVITICYWTMTFLTYVSTYMVDPELSIIFQSKKTINSASLEWKHVKYSLLLIAIPFTYSILVVIAPLMYVLDVLVGKEYFPYPDLLLNIIAMYLIVFSTVSGKLLMHKGEKRVANIIGG